MKQLLILVAALLVVSAMSVAQQTADIEFDATVASVGGPLIIAAGDLPTWDALRPGVSYNCVADNVVNTTNITPIDPNNAETFTPGTLDITGAPGAQAVLTFVLPTKLLPAAGLGYITMTYDNNSASVVDLNNTGLPFHFFNPTTPQTITIDAAGTAQILLAGNPSVTGDVADGDTFQGFGLVTIEYTGL